MAIAEAHNDVTLGDYGAALRRLESVEVDVFRDKRVPLQASWLMASGAAFWYLAEFERSERCYRQAAELWREAGDSYSRSSVLTTLTLLAGNLLRPREEQEARARQALQTAVASGNRGAAGRAHAHLGDLLPPDKTGERIDHAERALDLSRSAHDVAGIHMALRGLAHNLADSQPERALALIGEAIAFARRSGNRPQEARARIVRSRILWKTGPREQAIEASLAALDAVEATRELQVDGEARARRFSSWAIPYVELVNHLLAGDHLPVQAKLPREDLELAFQVMERTRARLLLDELDRASATPALAREGPVRDRWLACLEQISRLQRGLMDAGLDDANRDRLTAELEAQEREETALRAELARLRPAFGAVLAPRLATLEEVQRALADDQALISFWLHRTGWGSSRALVVTRASVGICPLPATEALDPVISLYLGLIGRGDPAESRGESRLYDLLLRCPIEILPRGIRRLIFVPHWSVTRLPLHVLRPSPEAETVGSRFETVTTPSASVWLRLRRDRPSLAAAAFAMADPAVVEGQGGSYAARTEQGAAWPRRPGPLPRARQEGRSVVHEAGNASLLLTGERASERALKQTDLSGFSILHFAAHAVTDEVRPDRSAILLAPGGPGEDGLLQLREIVDLELSGQLVVLSACRSASGLQIYGEGVLGLARGFFVAGARTVVGSLWPVRDVDAEALFKNFYRGLGEGKSVAAALASAQRQRLRDGAPPAAWAGLVVLGDGDLIPLPGGREGGGSRRFGILAIFALAGVVGLPLLGRRLWPRS